MGKIYVDSMIGENYLNWKYGQKIVITSTTGSGKSTFILKRLLPHAIAQGKHIVYLCNRKTLNDQLAVESRRQLEQVFETKDLTEQERNYIHIITYQHCEDAKEFPSFSIKRDTSGLSKRELAILKSKEETSEVTLSVRLDQDDILYYIFDEAHYFLSDSLFNPSTNYWHQKELCAISIFLTATPEPLFCFLASRMKENYNQPQIINEIYKRILEQRNIRALNPECQVSGFLVTNIHTHSAEYTFSEHSRTEIADKCREVNPFGTAFDFISSACKNAKELLPQTYFYPQNEDTNYSYITPFYFNQYVDLLERMANSNDKWLVFVDKENDGIDLTARLNERGCLAAYLSAKTRNKRKSEGYQEFINIIERQHFTCKVLVATSVIDCGVSITDMQLKNVVIGHSEKTEFLQMLGRKRVIMGESINLYIRYFEPKTINGLRSSYAQKLRFMVEFAQRNEITYIRRYKPTQKSDGMISQTVLPADRINKLFDELQQNSTLVYNQNVVRQGAITAPYAHLERSDKPQKILEEYQVSKTAFVYTSYLLKNYSEAVENHRVTQNPVFYLERQLSWIGKTYDVSNWVGYAERMSALEQFLENWSQRKAGIPKDQQDNFAAECLKLIQELPMPIVALGKNLSRYKEGSLPRKKKLNDIFMEIGMPYQIKSKQLASGNRETVWHVVHT